jgi:hypothetical protein
MDTLQEQLVEAVSLAAAGDWQRAHEIVQEHEEHPMANWIHALVHRIEGDLDNARYWYGRSGRQPAGELSPQDELRQIKAALLP